MDRLTRALLIERFHSYGRPREGWLIGGEFERIMVHSDGRPVTYFEPHGIRWFLDQLVSRFGWEPVMEKGNPIALTRGRASTTLEPGGQIELSGAPWASLHDLERETVVSLGELQSIAEGLDVHFVALGLTPYLPIDEVEWVPKGRYDIMREYLPAHGDLAHTMMKGTTSFQANFDYADEADCGRKVRAMSLLGPLTTAMFANSPILGGKDTGYASFRGHVWTRTDPARTGFPEAIREDWSHERYVDWLLDTPMMFIKRAGQWEHARGVTFRTWMEKGIDGHFPGWDEWELHMTSVFPEVRIKRTIEIRGADACPFNMAVSGIALWTGLLYDEVALDETLALVDQLSAAGTVKERFDVATREGLAGMAGGRRYSEWAQDLVAIGARGLSRSRPTERALLEPVEALVAHGESPAVAVRRIFAECGDNRACFLKRVRY